MAKFFHLLNTIGCLSWGGVGEDKAWVPAWRLVPVGEVLGRIKHGYQLGGPEADLLLEPVSSFLKG